MMTVNKSGTAAKTGTQNYNDILNILKNGVTRYRNDP